MQFTLGFCQPFLFQVLFELSNVFLKGCGIGRRLERQTESFIVRAPVMKRRIDGRVVEVAQEFTVKHHILICYSLADNHVTDILAIFLVNARHDNSVKANDTHATAA